MNAEWRAGRGADAVLIRDDSGEVQAAVEANPQVLTRFLTDMGDLGAWQGNLQVKGNEHNPDAWGDLVISRAESGEVINMDPERYWDGIYSWYRSRGVDYDSAERPNNGERSHAR